MDKDTDIFGARRYHKTARIQMLARLNGIMQRRITISAMLGRYYEAARLLAGDDEILDYAKLEENPKFRPLWLEDKDLKDEWTKLLLDLG